MVRDAEEIGEHKMLGKTESTDMLQSNQITMRLGIDFGTTHTVAALADRGNYPVVPLGEHDVCPSLVAAHPDGRVLYGRDAATVRAAREPRWRYLRSMKRLLHGAGPLTEVELAGRV